MTWGPLAFKAVGGAVTSYGTVRISWDAVGDGVKHWWSGLQGKGEGDGDEGGHDHVD
jgi:hypothetical protein